MYRVLRFILILVLGCGHYANGAISESRQTEIKEQLRGVPFFNVTRFSEEEKQWTFEWIADQKKGNPAASDFDCQLIQLGNRATIEKYGEFIKAGDFSTSIIICSAQPRLIPYFEGLLNIEEPAWVPQISDVTGWRKSVSAAGLMLKLTADSPELNGESREWARELNENLDRMGGDDLKTRRHLEEARNIVRDWWKENKAAIVEERFSDVKPGRIHTVILEKQPKPEPIEPAESVVKRPENRGESSGIPKAAQEVAEAPKESSNWYWVVPAVCVALLFGLFAALRKNG